MRGRADEHDRAVLDVGEQHVLLGLVEAVNLVDEEDGPHAAQLVAGLIADLADVGDIGDDARAAHEVALGGLGDDFRECGLAAAGRTEENDVREAVRLDHTTQQLALAEDVALADNLLKGPRTHPRRKGFCRTVVHSTIG